MMAQEIGGKESAKDFQWFVAERWQEYYGENHANKLRLICIASFYVIELINYFGLDLGFFRMPRAVDEHFHVAATALALSWSMLGTAILVCLKNRIFPRYLKYISTFCDVFSFTAVLLIADGPKSPLLVGYFLILALSALRFNLPLVRFATAASAASYLFVVFYFHQYRALILPSYHVLIFVLSLSLTGILLGQIIRRIRTFSEDYVERLKAQEGGVR